MSSLRTEGIDGLFNVHKYEVLTVLSIVPVVNSVRFFCSERNIGTFSNKIAVVNLQNELQHIPDLNIRNLHFFFRTHPHILRASVEKMTLYISISFC